MTAEDRGGAGQGPGEEGFVCVGVCVWVASRSKVSPLYADNWSVWGVGQGGDM